MAFIPGQELGGSGPEELVRQIAELRESLRRAEENSSSKSAFIANLSHEILMPLNSIIGIADLFQKTNLDLEQKKFAEMLFSSARDLQSLVGELLDLSLIETKRLTLKKAPFQVRSSCSRAVRPLAVSVQERPLSLELHVEPDVPEFLSGDSARLGQVLRNMVTNSISFTPKGTISVKVFKNEEADSSFFLHATVTHPDGGCSAKRGGGIDYLGMERQDFAVSFQESGMGLVIARRIAEAMGGRLDTKFPDSGKRVLHFFAPMDRTLAEERGPEEKSGAALSPGGASLPGELSIMVVDDNRFNRSITGTILRKAGGSGWTVSTAENADEALRLLEEKRFDIVFMDVQMPGKDGLECTRLIRKRETEKGRKTVIIAMTAYAMEGDRMMCLGAGMNDYIAKPVKPGDLMAVISRNLVQA